LDKKHTFLESEGRHQVCPNGVAHIVGSASEFEGEVLDEIHMLVELIA
jgi:hypothetical protein